MTIFLCILALICCSTKVKGNGWPVVALYALEVVLVLGILPKNWGGAGKDDDFLRFVVSVFWPFSGPMFIGIALVAWVRRMATRPNVPRAVARDRSVR